MRWFLLRLWCVLTGGHNYVSDDRPYGGTCSKCQDARLFIHDGCI